MLSSKIILCSKFKTKNLNCKLKVGFSEFGVFDFIIEKTYIMK